jgi:hypothetical protein
VALGSPLEDPEGALWLWFSFPARCLTLAVSMTHPCFMKPSTSYPAQPSAVAAAEKYIWLQRVRGGLSTQGVRASMSKSRHLRVRKREELPGVVARPVPSCVQGAGLGCFAGKLSFGAGGAWLGQGLVSPASLLPSKAPWLPAVLAGGVNHRVCSPCLFPSRLQLHEES